MAYDDLRLLIPTGTPRYFARRGSELAGGLIHSPREYHALVAQRDWNLYLNVNPCTIVGRSSIRPKSSEINELHTILVDIDPVAPFADPFAEYEQVLEYLKLALRKGDDFSYVSLYSGRGIQIWLQVKPYAFPDNLARARLSRGAAAFLHSIPCGAFGCKVDTSCSDLARVGRMPGSTNTKTGEVARILDNHRNERELDPQFLLDLAGPDPEVPEVLPNADARPLGYLLPYLTARAVTFLTEGVCEPGRHAAAYAAAASLRDIGISQTRAKMLVRKGGQLCTPILSESEADRTTRSAYESLRKA